MGHAGNPLPNSELHALSLHRYSRGQPRSTLRVLDTGAESYYVNEEATSVTTIQGIGCQTYTWEMLGDQWIGTPTDILDAMSAAGYDGVEFSNVMIGDYFSSPDHFAADLQQRNLTLAAYAYSTTGFTDAGRFEADLAGAQKALTFSQEIGVMLCLGGASAPSRDQSDVRFDQAIRFYQTVAEQGARMGVTVCVHPHSHHGSLLESAAEYDRLLSATADSGLMFNPDAGHIMRGGQDLMDCVRRHRARIVHVHIKDVDANNDWQPLGQGIIDWQSFFGFLEKSGYQGWVVAEEESAPARKDPAAAVANNRRLLRSMGL